MASGRRHGCRVSAALCPAGITCENLPEVLAAGLTRVAVSGAITASSDPAAEVRRFLALLG